MNKWTLRIFILLLITSVLSYTSKKPIFREFEETIRDNEGKEYSLYFADIIGELSPNSYLIGRGFNRKYLVVETQGEFENGQTVSFRGMIKNGKLISNEHHLHKKPNMPYFLSIIGMGLFLIVFFKEWKVTIKGLSLRRR